MNIDRLKSTPAAGAPAAKPAVQAAPAAPKAAMAGDSYKPTDVKVITYNTAVGNSKIKTDQGDFLKLPFYQSVINGEPGAPILCLQEVGNEQRKKLEALSKNGNFTVLSQRVALNFKQNNLLIVPKRFKVEKAENTYFVGDQIKAAGKSLWNWIRGKEEMTFNKVWQLISPRGFQQMQLKDTMTGKSLTVFNAHTAYDNSLQTVHARQLMEAAREAAKKGPVIVGGDLNTLTEKDDPTGKDADTRQAFEGFTDMGPATNGKRHNIDWVLAKGFESVSSRTYDGESISLPGSPNADLASDHYAEEDVIRYQE